MTEKEENGFLILSESEAAEVEEKLPPEEEMTEDPLLDAIDSVNAGRLTYISAMEKSGLSDPINIIAGMLDELAGKG